MGYLRILVWFLGLFYLVKGDCKPLHAGTIPSLMLQVLAGGGGGGGGRGGGGEHPVKSLQRFGFGCLWLVGIPCNPGP